MATRSILPSSNAEKKSTALLVSLATDGENVDDDAATDDDDKSDGNEEDDEEEEEEDDDSNDFWTVVSGPCARFRSLDMFSSLVISGTLYHIKSN